ncbi:hypothetical protein DL768_009258 [Monosporascus sp. mg162]|nr:hypothetical protein DL768_009258 [Monosporascus sp. mg162]
MWRLTWGKPVDVFCTPSNKKYYSQVQYTPLDKQTKEIRLIKLLLEDGDSRGGDIRCELLQGIPLDQARNKFTALSYCAGSAHETKSLLVNGKTCNVFANLHHALLECRHFWSQHRPQQELLLWIDQICIHQPDLKERAHQVSFMGDIYRGAEQTLICLSTKDCDGRGFDWMEEILAGAAFSKNEYGLELRTFSAKFFEGWNEFLMILSSPWWSRAWVFQEFMLSKQPIFLYGRRSIPFHELDLKLERFFRILQDMDNHCHGTYERTSHNQKKELQTLIADSRRSREQVFRFLTRKDEFTNFSTTRIPGAGSSRAEDHFRPTRDLKGLLWNANFFNASDERDRVYAFLGLTDLPHGIVPKYSRNDGIERMWLDITRTIMTLENSIEALKYSCSSRKIGGPTYLLRDWKDPAILFCECRQYDCEAEN